MSCDIGTKTTITVVIIISNIIVIIGNWTVIDVSHLPQANMRVEKNMTVMPNIMGRSYLPSSSIVVELCFVRNRRRQKKEREKRCS